MPDKTLQVEVAGRLIPLKERVVDSRTSQFSFGNGTTITCVMGSVGIPRFTCGVTGHRSRRCRHVAIVRKVLAARNPRSILL